MQEMKPVKEGKVREIYDNGDSLIMVATDRISCFDVILNNEVTKKGTVLTQMSKFWFCLLYTSIMDAYKGELYECPVTVENEKDMEKALEAVNKAAVSYTDLIRLVHCLQAADLESELL